MTETALASRILLIAAALGVAGNLLFKGTALGLNLPVWMALLLAGLIYLKKSGGANPPARIVGLVAIALLFSCFSAWRHSGELRAANFVAVFAVLGLAAVKAFEGRLVQGPITDYTTRLAGRLLQILPASFMLLGSDQNWSRLKDSAAAERQLAAGRGLLIAIPVLLVFGGLFAKADAAFGEMMWNLVSFDAEELMVHTAVTGTFLLFAAGHLRMLFIPPSKPLDLPPKPPRFNLGGTEALIVFGLLNALFAAFVAVQFRYLFGGAESVSTVAGMTYSEYARSGFFELVWVAVLTLPLVLVGDGLSRSFTEGETAMFRKLSLLLVGLLFVVMLSAMQRMLLYIEVYGLTSLRLYPSAFMIWLALTFIWMVPTLLRGQRDRFAFGSLVAGLTVIAALNAVNPDGLIARYNLTRSQAKDIKYILSLSSDAVPAIVDALPTLAPQQQRKIVDELSEEYQSPPFDWREWSVSWGEAHRLVSKIGTSTTVVVPASQ